MHYIGVRDGKMKKGKQGKKFPFTQYTSALCRCIQNLKIMVFIGAEKSVTKYFIGEKEK